MCKQNRIKTYDELTFTDDFMFCKIMQNNPDIAKEVVELITGEKLGGIVVDERQKAVEITPDGRGVRLDVYLRDDKDTIYNIEMQNVKIDDIPKRARYYQGMIDVSLGERRIHFSELKRSYVIFLMKQDPFEQKLPIYSFENMCREKEGLPLGDETKKIFVNAKGIRGILSEEMQSFVDYLCDMEPTSELTKHIEDVVAQTKRNESWKGEFMTVYEHYQIEREEGHREGFAQGHSSGLTEGLANGLNLGLVNSVDNLKKNLSMTLADACKALGVSVDEYERARETKAGEASL